MLSIVPTIFFFVGVQFYNFWGGMGMLAIAGLIFVFLTNFMLMNPFTAMLEGQGLLCFNLDSTGIIRPILLRVMQPYVKGKMGADDVLDVYDRSTVLQLAEPETEGTAVVKNGKITITMTEGDYNRARFGFMQYPVLLYNAQIKSLLTKDFLSEGEKTSFAEHSILYTNRKIEELTSAMRDFGRYVVELTKPKDSFFKSKFFMWILIVGIILLLLLFAQPIIEQIMNSGTFNLGGLGGSPVVPAP